MLFSRLLFASSLFLIVFTFLAPLSWADTQKQNDLEHKEPIQDLATTIQSSEKVDLAELFKSFPGRWVGEGRMYSKGGKVDIVKCRVTYFLSEDSSQLKQNIRCASAGGKIEVKSVIHQDGENISGTWHETIYEMKGELSGRAIKDGLLVRIKGTFLQATMQLLHLKGKQVAEIQFNHETLVGLTLVLKKG